MKQPDLPAPPVTAIVRELIDAEAHGPVMFRRAPAELLRRMFEP